MEKKSYKSRLILLAVAIVVIFILYRLDITSYLTIARLHQYHAQLEQTVNEHYFYSVLIFIGAMIASVTLSIPFFIIIPIGGLLFGWVAGGFYSLAGAIIGGVGAFFSSRYLIGEFFQERWEVQLRNLNKELNEYGYLYLLGLHFFPLTPFFIFNILCGLTKVRSFTFLWTTIIGIAPSVFLYSFFGYKLTVINEFKELLSRDLIYPLLGLKALSVATLLFGRFGKKLIKK